MPERDRIAPASASVVIDFPRVAPERRRIGRRGRIGIIQPAPGVVLEYEWADVLPAEVIAPVARIELKGGGASDFQAASDLAPTAARDLASAQAGVIAYACSVGSLYAGPGAETRLTEQLAAASGRPAISLSSASVRALRALKVQHPVAITPYSETTNAWVQTYLRECGFDVQIETFGVGLAEIGDLQPREVADLCIAALDAHPQSDGLWIPCTAVQTLEAIPTIESRDPRPVVSGSQALMWACLRALGLSDRVAAGRLFTL